MTKRRSRLKSLVLHGLLVALSLLLALAACEAVLRLADYPAERPVWVESRVTAFKFAPNLREPMAQSEYDVLLRTNRLGLRDNEVEPKRGTRILLLGDSFTCGYGVDRQDLFADLLENKLGVDVINAGVGGFEIIHQLHYFRAEGRTFDPDLVVYALYLGNDLSRNGKWQSLSDNVLVARDGRPTVELPRRLKLVALLRRYTLLRRWRQSLRRRLQPSDVEWQPRDDYLPMCAKQLDETAQENYQVSKALLGQLRDEVTASGAEFLVAMFPYRTVVEDDAASRFASGIPEFAAHYDLERPMREMQSFCQEAGIECVNLVPILQEHFRKNGTRLYYPLDGHFTKEGHRVVAEHLSPILKQKIDRAAQDRAAISDQ